MRAQVLGGRAAQVDGALRAPGPTAIFSMYVSGALSRLPFSPMATTRDGVGRAVGAEVRALERVHRDVDLDVAVGAPRPTFSPM